MSTSPWARPVLRWAGSKRKLLPQLMACTPRSFRRYIEPFAGSACLFFALKPRRAILADLNPELVAFYATLRRSPKLLLDAVTKMPSTEEFYYHLREDLHTIADPVAHAAAFVYLNRFCFNGVFRTNKMGHFNVPRGRSTGSMPSCTDFLKASQALGAAEIFQADFSATISRAGDNDFVYADPPYPCVERPRYGEYGYGTYSGSDFHRLAASLSAADSNGATILVSYLDTVALRDTFPRWCFRKLSVRRHVAGFSSKRRNVIEVLASNCSLPEVI